jgi:hypothetical protein
MNDSTLDFLVAAVLLAVFGAFFTGASLLFQF